MKTNLFSFFLGALLSGVTVYFVFYSAPNAPTIEPLRVTLPPDSAQHVVNDGPQASPQINWLRLQSTDLRQYAENLRAAAIPVQVIQDIIGAEVERSLSLSWCRVSSDDPSLSYWTSSFAGESKNFHILKGFLENGFYLNRNEMIREVLGTYSPLLTESAISEHIYQNTYGFVDPEKRESLGKLKQRYEKAISASILGFPPDPVEIDKIAQLRRELDDEITKLLTSEEKADYDLRHSDLANRLRHKLSSFRPTEDEFRKIIPLEKEYESRTTGSQFAKLPIDVRYERQETAMSELSTGLGQVLGENRFREYRRSQDSEFLSLRRFVERQGIDVEVAAQIYDLRQEVQRFVPELSFRADLDTERKQQMVTQLREEVEKRFETMLGQKAFAQFKVHPVSAWLGAIDRSHAASHPR